MPRRTIRIDDEDWILLERIAKKEGFTSNNEIIGFLIKQKITGGSNNPELTVKQQFEKEKLRKIEFENQSLAEIKKRKLEAETTIKEYHAKHVDVIGTRPSATATRAMKHHTTPKLNGFNEYVQKKYTLNYFENDELCHKALCKICETLFESKDKQEVTDDVVWHIEEIHNQRAEIVVSRN